MVDVAVSNHGSIYVFYIQSPEAEAWVEEHVGEDVQWWGKNGLVVEPRYANDLVDGMTEAGLNVG